MTTYIILPARELGTARVLAQGRTNRIAAYLNRRQSHVDLLRRTLADAGRADAAVSVEGIRTDVPLQGSAAAQPGTPLSLDALGAILLRDPAGAELEKLRRSGALVVENVEISGSVPVARSAATDTPPIEADLWHLDRVGARAFHGRGLTGKGVLLGVIDTGVDADHPDLAGQVAHYAAFGPDGDFIGSLRKDYGDHGTHVCGTIAGRSCGVAPGASLAVAAALTRRDASGRNTGTLAQVLAALNWLIQTEFGDQAVAAINASLGGTGYDEFAYDVIANARSIQRTLVVAAIGNSGKSGPGRHGSPGNYDIVLGIGATDRDDKVAAFSDHGAVAQHAGIAKPDMSAPGVGIMSAVPNGMYASMSGTSMASPVVTGACALLAERDASLLEAPDRLEAAVRAEIHPLPDQPAAGRGVLSLSKP